MTIDELITRLQSIRKNHGNIDVMILDGWNGSGVPRTINLGPERYAVTAKDAEETADCEGLVLEEVVVMGFGCY